MLEEIDKEESFRKENNVSLNHSHKFSDFQWEYNKSLAKDAGFLHLIQPVVQKIYDRAGIRRANNPERFKFDKIVRIDKERFEYVDDAHLPS